MCLVIVVFTNVDTKVDTNIHTEVHTKIPQHARKLVGAEPQQITRYQKYLPVVPGKRTLCNFDAKGTVNDQNVVPSIHNEFATVAFR